MGNRESRICFNICSNLINVSEFSEIWDKIRILDFKRYQDLAESDLIPVMAQPDDGMIASIKIKINGDVLVDRFFAGPTNTLTEDLAKPLDGINSLIAEKVK